MNIYISILLWATYLLSLYFSIFFFLVFLDKKDAPSPTLRLRLRRFPLVTVLIPAYNEEETIVEAIRSVLSLHYPKDKLDIIVINDGSTDKTAEKISEFIADKSHVRLVSHQNMGKAASLNAALKHATGEFFACLDADSFVEPGALRNMLALYFAHDDPQLAIITPALKVKSPKNLLQRVQWIEYLVMVLISRLASRLDCLYVAPGPFSLYRTHIVRDLGGFDEHNLTEDQEIAYRVQLHQYCIIQCPSAFVHTLAPATLGAFYRQRRRWYKGSLSCLHQYKHLILNKRYGDFGVIQMLKNSLGFLIAVSGMFFAFYFIVLPIFHKIYDLSIVGFDFWPYLQHLTFSFTFLSIDIEKVFIVSILFLIGFTFFYAAHRNASERFNTIGWIPVIPYFFLYYLVKGSILLFSLVEYSMNRKQKW